MASLRDLSGWIAAGVLACRLAGAIVYARVEVGGREDAEQSLAPFEERRLPDVRLDPEG